MSSAANAVFMPHTGMLPSAMLVRLGGTPGSPGLAAVELVDAVEVEDPVPDPHVELHLARWRSVCSYAAELGVRSS